MSSSPWKLSENSITDEKIYLKRRSFLKQLGLGMGIGASIGLGYAYHLYQSRFPSPPKNLTLGKPLPSLTPHLEYQANHLKYPVTSEKNILSYNNFYEFTKNKTQVWKVAHNFRLNPYHLEIDGLVEKPKVWDLDDILSLGVEERVYRFRCVEAWSMVVPWAGVPLAKLLQICQPKPEAKYVTFTSFLDPTQAPGQRQSYYHWPYYEALSLPEAVNELSFLAVGIYGRSLRPQNGAPLRLVVPWKYGYKSAKSVVRITLTKEMPGTFWSDLVPLEYGFEGNVNPQVPHPRWSQARETMLETGAKVKTELYNGYQEQVAHLYS